MYGVPPADPGPPLITALRTCGMSITAGGALLYAETGRHDAIGVGNLDPSFSQAIDVLGDQVVV